MRIALLVVVLALPATAFAGPSVERGTATITTRDGATVTLRVELARTAAAREQGLMNRRSLGAKAGMAFLYPESHRGGFWMRNTLIPLSIAFLADDGSIVNIDDMAPQTLDGHCSEKPVRYDLEMNKGCFAKRGLKPGSKLRGTPFAH